MNRRKADKNTTWEDTLHRKVLTFIYDKDDEERILKIAKEAKKRDLTHKDFGQTSFFQDVHRGDNIPQTQKQNMEDMNITHGAAQKSLASVDLFGLVNPHKEIVVELENDKDDNRGPSGLSWGVLRVQHPDEVVEGLDPRLSVHCSWISGRGYTGFFAGLNP